MSRITEDKRIHKLRTEQEMRDALAACIHGKIAMHIPPDDDDTDIVLYDMLHELLEMRHAVKLLITGSRYWVG